MQFLSLIPIAIGAIIVVVLVFVVLRNKKRARLIEDAPLCKVKELRSGPAKVEGEVVALEDPIKSPMTRERCVYYRFRVEEQRTRTVTEHTGSGRGMGTRTRTERYWETVIDDIEHVACGVQDETGTAEVEVGDAELVLTTASRLHSGTMNSCPKDLQRMLMKKYGHSTQGLIFNKTMRYTETIICEGDPMFVLGTVEKVKGQKPIFIKTGDHPLIVSDKEEDELLKHYHRTALYSTIGAVAAGVIAIAVAAIMFATIRK